MYTYINTNDCMPENARPANAVAVLGWEIWILSVTAERVGGVRSMDKASGQWHKINISTAHFLFYNSIYESIHNSTLCYYYQSNRNLLNL